MAKPAFPDDQLALYLETAEHIQHGLIWFASDGNTLGMNTAFATALGYEKEALERKSVFLLSPHINFLEWRKIWDKLLTSRVLSLEIKHITPNGALFPVRLRAVGIEFDGETICCGILENRLPGNRYHELLRLTEEISQAGSWEWDILHNEILLSHGLANLMGLPRVEKLTRKQALVILKKSLFPEELHQLTVRLESALQSGTPFEMELSVRMPKATSGTRMNLAVKPVQQDGKTGMVYGTFQDLSNIATRTEALYLTQYCIDNASQMIYWLQSDGRFIYANNAFCEKLGYTSAELLSMRLIDIEPGMTEADWKKRWNALKQNGTLELETTRQTKNGDTIPVMLHLNYLPYKDQEFNLAFASDLRNKKRMEETLHRRLKEIESLHRQLEEENIILKEEIEVGSGSTNIISQSPNYKKILRQIELVAETQATVLILGETGTGKELIAKAIHRLSSRSDRPMIKVNCGALPENLIESELFGHEKGAFTGAHQRKPGRFEMAHQSTIFLDEIGELPLDLQVKLLRVLQEGTFEPLGSTESVTVDVRVIAATNRNLEEQLRKGKFREDLYYRLNVFPIFNIPLRERKEDIPLLVRHFIEKYNKKLGKQVEEIAPTVLKELEEYEFPGNVRELENLIERSIILSPGKTLAANFQFKKSKAGEKKVFKTMEGMQRDHIIEALQRSNGQITGKNGAARLLNMNDKTLYSRMQKLGIGRHDYAS